VKVGNTLVFNSKHAVKWQTRVKVLLVLGIAGLLFAFAFFWYGSVTGAWVFSVWFLVLTFYVVDLAPVKRSTKYMLISMVMAPAGFMVLWKSLLISQAQSFEANSTGVLCVLFYGISAWAACFSVVIILCAGEIITLKGIVKVLLTLITVYVFGHLGARLVLAYAIKKSQSTVAVNICTGIIHCRTAPDYSRKYAQAAYDNWLNGSEADVGV